MKPMTFGLIAASALTLSACASLAPMARSSRRAGRASASSRSKPIASASSTTASARRGRWPTAPCFARRS